MEVECEARGGVVRDDRFVDVHRGLRLSGGAARKCNSARSCGSVENREVAARGVKEFVEIERRRRNGALVSRINNTCSSAGIWARTGSTFLRYNASVVTSTRARAIVIRDTMGSGPNAEKSGV